jgi:hypothetical protein
VDQEVSLKPFVRHAVLGDEASAVPFRYFQPLFMLITRAAGAEQARVKSIANERTHLLRIRIHVT